MAPSALIERTSVEIIVVWLLLAAGVGFLADARGRNFFGYFLLSAVLSPLLGLIVVLVSANLKEQEAKELQRKADQEAQDIQRKADHERELESIRAIATATTSAASVTSEPPKSIAEELTKLAALREQGVLTPEEFTDQKARLLART